MVLYHAMASEGRVCLIALGLEEVEKEEEEMVEEQEHRERGVALACARHCLDRR